MTAIDGIKALAPWTEALPPDWKISRIDDVADVLFSNVDKHMIEGEQSVKLCNYVDVYKNERITAALDFMEASAEPREIAKFQIRRHDVLATKDSEEPDDIAIAVLVAEDLPGVLCGYHLAMIRPRSNRIYGPFIAWAHASKQFRAQYEAKAVGVTRFGLSQYTFRAARIPLPSPSEQERIAAYLDASCAAIDAAVAAKRRQIDVLDALRKSLAQQVLSNGLRPALPLKESGIEPIGMIPSHWSVKQMRYACKINYGITLQLEEGQVAGDGVRILTVSNVNIDGLTLKMSTTFRHLICRGRITYNAATCFLTGAMAANITLERRLSSTWMENLLTSRFCSAYDVADTCIPFSSAVIYAC